MGCIYFYKHNNLSPIKIGMTKEDNPSKRVYSFLTAAPYGGELLEFFTTPNASKVEKEIHEELKEDRLYGEWFEIDMDDVHRLCRKHIITKVNKVDRILLDIPFHVDEIDKTIEKLTFIKTVHYYINSFSKVTEDELSGVLILKSNLSDKQINDLDLISIYERYFSQDIESIKLENKGL